MKLHQLSLFVENKPGQLAGPARVLADNGINILTLSLADTQQFGILRLIAQDWARAKAVLEQAGAVVNVTEVVAIGVDDKPGGLADILRVLDETGTNVEYMYAFTSGRPGKAILVFRFENPDAAIRELQARKINIVGSAELYEGVER